MEKALAAIHQACRSKHIVTLGYTTIDGYVSLFLRFPREMASLVLEPVIANYPNGSVTHFQDLESAAGSETWTTDLTLHPDLFPILRHAQFEDALNGSLADPANVLLRAIKPAPSIQARMEFIVSPASRRRRKSAIQTLRTLDRDFFRKHRRLADFFVHNLSGPGWAFSKILGALAHCSPTRQHSSLEVSSSRIHDREDDLQAAAEKIGGHLFEVRLRLVVEVPSGQKPLAVERLNQMASAFGAFTKSRLATFRSTKVRCGSCDDRGLRPFLLSHEELATLFHPPTAMVEAERMQTREFAELEAPVKLYSGKEEGSATLGVVRFRNESGTVGLGREDRRRHVHIIGKTGMGKSTLLENMISSDITRGMGVCLVDPHGDLAERIVGLVPKCRTNDVILFDAACRESTVGFNPLACPDPNRIDQVTSGVVSAFRKLHDSWGPRLEDTLRNAVFAIVEQNGTLMSVMKLLGEKSFREQIVPNIRDEVVRSFWMHEFACWSDNYRTEAVAAIQNKIRPFLTNSIIRNIVNGSGNSIDLRKIMDEGKVLIVNLSKGRLGEDNSNLLGAFLVTSIQLASMTRADLPESERADFVLYVDEFQNFTTGSFASVLSEARKYHLSLVVAHQYLSQLDTETSNAVFGNVGSIIAFQVGSDDAEVLAQQIGKYPGQIGAENFTGLPKFTAYARLLIDGLPSNPFSMRTLPPSVAFDPERAKVIRRVSKRRFAPNLVATEPALVTLAG